MDISKERIENQMRKYEAPNLERCFFEEEDIIMVSAYDMEPSNLLADIAGAVGYYNPEWDRNLAQ